LVAKAVPVETAALVATTSLQFGSQTPPGSLAVPPSVSAGQLPHTPDVGDDASATTTHPSTLSHTSKKANPASPTVAATPISAATPGLTATVAGLDGFDQGITHPAYTSSGQAEPLPGVDLEPPDQGVCAGNGFVLEVNNMVAKVYRTGLTSPTAAAPLESLFDTPEVFGAANDGSLSIQGDPRCFYDAGSGRWFASELWLDLNDATTYGWAGTFLAVSTTSDPTGTWNVYFVPDAYNATNTATCNNVPPTSTSPVSSPCYGDQPLLGVDGYSVQLSTNEYSFNYANPNGPAGLYFLSKSQMVAGASSVPVLFSATGATVAAPGNGTWYSIDPAQAPDGAYSAQNHGTSYALSSLDFFGSGDNRIAEWAFTNTNAVNGGGSVNIFEQTLNSGQYGAPPVLVAQKLGPTPLGDFWNQLNGNKGRAPVHEGGIAANDDRMTAVTVDPSNGALFGALNTGINQPRSGSTVNRLAGVAHFAVTPALTASGLGISSVTTGYISPSGANAIFPGVAVTNDGAGVINYTLTGTGNYPSQAYSLVASREVVDPTAHVARNGAGPQDGFSEYQDLGTSLYSPRWGDYGAAIATGKTITFANEMINQSCTDQAFQQDFTCSGTRDLFINWGTGISVLNAG
jgi:hypothetical protein